MQTYDGNEAPTVSAPNNEIMKYRLLLKNKANGDVAEVMVPSHMPLEDLSVNIKLEMHLPYTDGGWHRFLVGGVAYMPEMHCVAEPEMLEESSIATVRSYRPSESVSLAEVFTVLQSAVTYTQDDGSFTTHKITCTLVERRE